MEVVVVGVGDRPTYINNLISHAKSTDIDVRYISSESDADVHIPLATGSDIEFLIKFSLYVVFGKIRIDADVVHVRRIVTLFPFFFITTDAELIATCPGELTEELKMNHSNTFVHIYGFIELFGARAADTIIAVSDSTREYLIGKYPRISDKVRVVSVGVDTSIFHPKDRGALQDAHQVLDSNVLLYAGRFSEVKNLPLLVDVFERLEERGDWVLYLAGDGEKTEEILTSLEKRELAEQTEYFGYVDQGELSDLMNIADCFLFTSRSEGSPNVVREALACGLPVVSTNVGDLSKIVINGKNGYVVDYNARIMRRKIEIVADNSGSFREAARETETSFQQVFNEIVAIYRHSVEEKYV